MEKIILKKQEFEAVTLDLTKADAKFTLAKKKLHDFIAKNFGAKNKELYFEVKDYIAEDASKLLQPQDQGKPVDEAPQDQIPAIKEDGQLTVKLTRGELKNLVDMLIDNLTNSPKSWFIVDFSDKITVIPQEAAKEA